MVSAAAGRPIIEMGSRRTHEMAARRRRAPPTWPASPPRPIWRRCAALGFPARAPALTPSPWYTHDRDEAAFRSQIEALGVGTTLLVDTYDITAGVATAVAVAGPELGGVRIDSGDLGVLARQVRKQLDDLGARNTKIVLSGDLDEYAIAALRAEPVDAYGVGTSLVTGSGAPTCGMVYKLVEVDGMPVVKRSSHKESRGGTKRALRRFRSTGTMTEEVVFPAGGATAAAPETATYRSGPTSSASYWSRWCATASRWPISRALRRRALSSRRACTRCPGRASSSRTASRRSRPSSSPEPSAHGPRRGRTDRSTVVT